MNVRDMRKEPKETCPTLSQVRYGEAFEFVDPDRYMYGPVYIRTNSGSDFSFMSVQTGAAWSNQSGLHKVRFLKATLVLEDEGTASK